MTLSQARYEMFVAAAAENLPRVLMAAAAEAEVVDPRVPPMWRAARWSLMRAPATFIDASCPAYLQIDVDFRGNAPDGTAAVASSDRANEKAEEAEAYHALALDDATLSSPLPDKNDPACRRCTYRAQIDVVLHPMYRVPCPYLRVFTASTGQPVPVDQALTLLTGPDGAFSGAETSAGTAVEAAAEGSPVGTAAAAAGGAEYGVEEHPFLHTPCLCVHVCGVGECLAALAAAAEGGRDEAALGAGPYLARWLALVGPALGLRVSPQLFVAVCEGTGKL
jgi:hypothetical protein